MAENPNRPAEASRTKVEASVLTGDPKDMWSIAMGLPKAERFMESRWPEFLPPCVSASFVGIALIIHRGLTGETMREAIADFMGNVLCAAASPEQPSVRFVEKRFRDYYGEYEKTPAGMFTVLNNLGLVLMDEDGETLEIPETLPTPEKRLNLCVADVNEPVVFEVRYRTTRARGGAS